MSLQGVTVLRKHPTNKIFFLYFLLFNFFQNDLHPAVFGGCLPPHTHIHHLRAFNSQLLRHKDLNLRYHMSADTESHALPLQSPHTPPCTQLPYKAC